ncbi:MAG TPA: Rieske 2Fe-2S domain-containing protein [Stellaceae bacterium]|jgi:5,5'-dehydrodivanillate O-demethylase oxygenase subunit|nr:Rieske 2Fe-2S domain-containing protein [Stellaceae bacterium]
MGRYLRCFWYPVASVAELKREPVKAVTLLGEKLALFLTEEGTYGLVGQRCPHRGTSLACGMAEAGGIRCAYHGWKFSVDGRCLDQPAEHHASTMKNEIRIDAYPVQEMGGLLWAYLGRAPAPLLPRFEFMVRDDYDKDVGISRMPCNWLQIAENTMDPLHIEYLHMRYTNYVNKRKGLPPVQIRTHKEIAFDIFEYGINKRRLWEGDSPDSQEWTIGHPQIFPGHAMVAYGGTDWVQYQLRIPVDDTNTILYWYNSRRRDAGKAPQAGVSLWENPWSTPGGDFIPEQLNAQDMMVMITQGDVTDHALEHLGRSDRGVVLYRETLLQQMERVAKGEDPLGVVRDPAKTTPWIDLPIERHLGYSFSGIQSSAAYDYPVTEAAPAESEDGS